MYDIVHPFAAKLGPMGNVGICHPMFVGQDFLGGWCGQRKAVAAKGENVQFHRNVVAQQGGCKQHGIFHRNAVVLLGVPQKARGHMGPHPVFQREGTALLGGAVFPCQPEHAVVMGMGASGDDRITKNEASHWMGGIFSPEGRILPVDPKGCGKMSSSGKSTKENLLWKDA